MGGTPKHASKDTKHECKHDVGHLGQNSKMSKKNTHMRWSRVLLDGHGGCLWMRMGAVGTIWGLGLGKEAGRDTSGHRGQRLYHYDQGK